jgi:hypothetical protein
MARNIVVPSVNPNTDFTPVPPSFLNNGNVNAFGVVIPGSNNVGIVPNRGGPKIFTNGTTAAIADYKNRLLGIVKVG